MAQRTWEWETPEGHSITVTLSPTGAVVSLCEVDGRREGHVVDLDEFSAQWRPWLEGLDLSLDGLDEALERCAAEAALADDEIA
ncbi:MAG: hypothetical protein JNK72_16020 [Myxococcales bacterium]|nr:hypothetical protein [Myxococcales bacterium]